MVKTNIIKKVNKTKSLNFMKIGFKDLYSLNYFDLNHFMRFFLIITCFSLFSPAFSGNIPDNGRKLTWEGIKTEKFSDNERYSFISFKGAIYDKSRLPQYFERIRLNPGSVVTSVELTNPVFIEVSNQESALINVTNNDILVNAKTGYERKDPYAIITFTPIRKNQFTGKYEKLVSFGLKLNTGNQNALKKSLAGAKKNHVYNSILASGNWFRVALTKDGIYKMSYSFLKNLGVDVKNIDPHNIHVYGNGGGQLPYPNSQYRQDDLAENAIYVQGESDGKLDSADYVLFYGQQQHRWTFDSTACPAFQHHVNIYSDTTYYFISTDANPGKRITQQLSVPGTPTNFVSSFDDFNYTEENTYNLLQSGREWYGFNFDILTSDNISYTFSNVDVTSPATVRVDLVSRYSGGSSYLATCGSASKTLNCSGVPVDLYYGDYVSSANACMTVNNPGNTVNVTINKLTADATGWLNYVEVNVRRLLNMVGDQMIFRDSKSLGAGKVSQFSVTGPADLQIWETTDPKNVKAQSSSYVSGTMQFSVNTDSLREFIAFTGSSFFTPTPVGPVPNQNLHSLPEADLVIVTNSLFVNQANRLADLHRTNDNMNVVVVTSQQVYNEFSSGAQDVCAIRDFMKMFYDRSTGYRDIPKYLLLFGDGSYDNLYRLPNNTNFIPTYQSLNSHDPTDSYVSDDYYGLLDDSEGNWTDSDPGLADIGVGRLPADNTQDAEAMLNKIIKYSGKGPTSDPTVGNSCVSNACTTSYGDWRNTICFVADDGDNDAHISQADQLANYVTTNYKNFNLDKIYVDSYIMESGVGGNRYPAAEDAINQVVEKGAFIVNYTGHGGQLGWSHERVLGLSDITAWNNLCKLPLFVTATCEFSRFDDPALVSAGEEVLLNPNGGGIGLFTTVRLVYSSPNFTLNYNFYTCLYDTLPDGQMPRIGDLFRTTKILSGANVNNRNFTLLGDPALRMVYPKYTVITDSINGKKLSVSITDTTKALSKVTVSGHLTDQKGNILSGYNGYLFPTVYDKPSKVVTLSNLDTLNSPHFTFLLQKNMLYKGSVSVTNGNFHFSYVVPKDINYQYGQGKISYYAENANDDASGNFDHFYVGGTATNIGIDNIGPDVKLYLNDNKFVFGGTTNQDPFLYAVMKDSSGINTVGNGIGHDIVAILDGNSEKTTLLNDYYQADLNSYKSGKVRYPFQNLTQGKHTLTLKVWDIYNNSSQTYTEFIVANTASLALTHVLNYPNPFTTKTSFYFEQNRCCEQMDVMVQIFTISGKLIKSINTRIQPEGFRSDPIDWDGKDEFGDNIGRGVYVYHVKIRASDGSTADKFEKLVILN